MSRVNVVLPGGQVVSVDEDTAKASGLGLEGVDAAKTREENAAREAKYGGIGGAVNEALYSGADTLTLGGFGKADEFLFGDDVQKERADSAAVNPTAHIVGELGAMFVPGLGEASGLGLAAKAGEGVTALTDSVALGRATEGAILGVGSHVADSNVTGDPLTIEGFVHSAGMGAILNMGAGLVVDRLTSGFEGMANRADARLAELKRVRSDAELAEHGAKIFDEPNPSWDEFRELQTAAERSIGSYNREVERDTAAYQDFLSTNAGIGAATEKAQAAVNRIRNEALAAANSESRAIRTTLESSGAWREFSDAHNANESAIGKVNRDIQRANDSYATMEGSNEKLTGAIDEAEQVIRRRRQMYSDGAAGDARPPITDSLRAKLDAYDSRISDMYKRKAGGWRSTGNQAWERDVTVAADPAGALEDLRTLHTELRGEMPKASGRLSDLPSAPQPLKVAAGVKLPTKLSDFGSLTDNQLTRVARSLSDEAKATLSKLASDVGVKETGTAEQTLRALRDTVKRGVQPAPIDQALTKSVNTYSSRLNDIRALRATDPTRAVEELRALQRELQAEFPKTAGALKDIPTPPLQLKAASDIKIPRTLREFARMRPDSIARLANQVDPQAAAAFVRFANDSGMAVQATAAETIAGVHKRLSEYEAAAGRVKAHEAKLAATKNEQPLALRVLERIARAAAGHAVGGPFGSALGMLGLESGIVGNTMLSAREAFKTKVTEAVAKWGRGGARALGKLRPVTTWLGQTFGGAKDPEKDLQKQAVNRVNELYGVNQTAPDNGYLAVQGLMGHPADLAWKVQSFLVGAANHLASTAPKDPGIDVTLNGSNWTPSLQQSYELAYRLEAAHDPIAALTRILAGDGHPAAADTLRVMYPGLLEHAIQELAFTDTSKLSPSDASAMTTLLGTPMTGLTNPQVMTAIQGIYMEPPSKSKQGVTRDPYGQPVGRPAAVQNEVAGSSVARLLGQTN